MTAEINSLNNILPQDHGKVYLAGGGESQARFATCLASSIGALDEFLGGGLRCGELSEWGVPLGRGGRDIIIRYLAKRTQNEAPWCLWVSGNPELQVYPPAWLARGVSLRRVRFAHSLQPVSELKPVFLDPFFKLIVLDMPRRLSRDDCAFLAQRARANRQTIILLRDYFLSTKRGNVWTKLRLNCWHDAPRDQYHVRVIRGLAPRELSLALKEKSQCLSH